MFRYDFNRIMRIVDAIESKGVEVIISKTTCSIKMEDKYYKQIDSNSKLESVYNSCVDFIKWYNSIYNK